MSLLQPETSPNDEQKTEYMWVYLCDDWNRGLILIPIPKKEI